MATVPAKTLRLSELEESDRTAYFSVTALLERGKAVAARTAPPPAAAPTPAASAPLPEAPMPAERPQLTYVASPPKKPGPWQQLREASPAKKAIVVMLPLLLGAVALEPMFEKQKVTAATAAAASSVQNAPLVPREVTEQDPEQLVAPSPAPPPPALPKGVTLERAAVDAISGGDFQRALGFYRELSRREPTNAAYREATRILERRSKAKEP